MTERYRDGLSCAEDLGYACVMDALTKEVGSFRKLKCEENHRRPQSSDCWLDSFLLTMMSDTPGNLLAPSYRSMPLLPLTVQCRASPFAILDQLHTKAHLLFPGAVFSTSELARGTISIVRRKKGSKKRNQRTSRSVEDSKRDDLAMNSDDSPVDRSLLRST